MYRFSMVLVVVLMFTFAGIVFAEPNMQDGKWEITTKMEMKGMPMQMPPMKFTDCLNKKDYVPQKEEKNQDCKMISNKISGDTVTWVMQCKDKEGTYDSDGKITYKGNTFDGVVNMTITEKNGQKMHATQHMSGKRIGDCK